MMITLKNGKLVEIRLLRAEDEETLFRYLDGLSAETRSRYGPHPFDRDTVHHICQTLSDELLRYIAINKEDGHIIAYMLIKKGMVEEDRQRYATKHMHFDETLCCTFAPSVADAWQNSGLGSAMYAAVENDLRKNTVYKNIILWGGVQATNRRAVHYYEKLGYRHLGHFFRNGLDNYDMVKEL